MMSKGSNFIVLATTIILSVSCVKSQSIHSTDFRLVGGPCEGCDGIFEYGEKQLLPSDTIMGFKESSAKIKISGTVYQPDGQSPAPGVILYFYHTDETGLYAANRDEVGWGKRHGSKRIWLKTGLDGRYEFYSTFPGTYPSRTEPAHIHPTVLEPNGKYYWIDAILFAGDPLLSEEQINEGNIRGGGNAIIELNQNGDLLIGRRDIILGKNIQDY